MMILPERLRIEHPTHLAFRLDSGKGYGMLALVSPAEPGLPWEHVSVSRDDKQIPSWEDMVDVRRAFWEAEDTVIEIHPPMSQYVNNHPGVLHLWRSTNVVIPLPPRECV